MIPVLRMTLAMLVLAVTLPAAAQDSPPVLTAPVPTPPVLAAPVSAAPSELSDAELMRRIEAELSAWQSALEAAEALPPPEGSRRAVEDEIARLGAAAPPEVRARIEALVRQAAVVWSQPPPMARPDPLAPSSEVPADPSQPDLAIAAPGAAPDPQPPTGTADAGTGTSGTAGGMPDDGQPFDVAVAPPPSGTDMPAPAAVADPGGATRLLSLPGAQLIRRGMEPEELAPFTILYAHGRIDAGAETQFEVGRSRDSVEGRIRESQTEEWRSMLVMQYASQAGRERAVFFREAEDIQGILRSHFSGPEGARSFYADLYSGQFDRDRIMAIEPERPVRSARAPYFMPIIDFRRDVFDNLEETPVFLLQLAAVNLQTASRFDADPVGEAKTTGPDATALRELRAGIVFVVDTTISMGPYIDAVRDFLRFMRREADRVAPGQVDFGLLGYRDNMDHDPRLEYLIGLYLPLGPQDRATFDDAVASIRPSSVPTRDWREDAFAGMQVAIDRLDWQDYDARFLVLVTDAGARTIGDPLAADPELGPQQIGRLAERRGISLQIMHMQTPEGQSDHPVATELYRSVVQAAGDAASRYYMVRGDAPARFADALSQAGTAILASLETMAQGEVIEREAVAGSDPILQDLLDPTTVSLETAADARQVAAAFGDQFFVFQQEYLGRLEEGEAPDFYRAWVADRDLINPAAASMQVKVLVTRNQLSDLAARLRDIVRRLDERETGTQDAFLTIAGLSGVTTYDPNLTISDLLPEYLSNLPYVSTFMNLTAEQWASLGLQQQGELLAQVRDRISLLESINLSSAGWLPLPGRAGGEEVYPLNLDDLP